MSFHTMPWPVWFSALLVVAIGLWTSLSAWAARDPFGLGSIIFFVFAVWIARKAPRERTVFERGAAEIRFDEGFIRLGTRARLPFDDIDLIAVEHNRARHMFRVVAVSGEVRYPVGRGFVTPLEASQRIGAIAAWMGEDGPKVDVRLEEDEDENEDED